MIQPRRLRAWLPAAAALTALCAIVAGQEAVPERYAGGPGLRPVEELLLDWHDDARDRPVPAKVYYPAGEKGPCPLIVLSHGLGGSREGYAYLGRHWASHGYISVHLQHLGSDDAVWRGQAQPMEAMKRAAADWRNALARPRDVSFAIDELARMNDEEEGPLSGLIDLDRIGMAGHSFGAHTTLIIAGEVMAGRRGPGLQMADPRVSAAIPMSAPVPSREEAWEKAFSGVAIPCLHMTGTLDQSIVSDTTPEQRRVPFDHIDGVDQYLITFEGGDHMVFSGRPRNAAGAEKDLIFQGLIRQASLAFWDAYLRDDDDAKAWLADGGFAGALGADGVFEVKTAD